MQLSFFKNSSTITPNQVRCWRCQEYFSFSKIRFFDCMYPSGHVGTYQACEACYRVIMANRGCL